MKLITNKYNKEVKYSDIIRKQKAYKRLKEKQQSIADREASRVCALHSIRTQQFDSVLNCHSNQIGKLARIQADAQKLVGAANRDMSLYEVEKLIQDVAPLWEAYTTEEENSFFTPLELWGVDYYMNVDNAKRRSEWIKNVVRKPQYSSFYVVANMPIIDLKFDTRTKVFTYDKVMRKTVKKPEMAVYSNYNATRWSIITKILMRIGYKMSDEDTVAHRNEYLKQWLSDNNLELSSSFVHVPCIHSNKLSEYPALVFSLSRNRNSATSFVYDTDKSVVRRSDEQVVIQKQDDDVLTTQKPLTYYELEDYVIKGVLDRPVDNTANVVITSIEEAFVNDSKGALNKEIADLPIGIDTYANVALGLGRTDLVILATDEDEPTCPMTPDIADAIWNGEFNHDDAEILYGSMFLRQSLDILIDARWLEFEDEEDEAIYYYAKLESLGLGLT